MIKQRCHIRFLRYILEELTLTWNHDKAALLHAFTALRYILEELTLTWNHDKAKLPHTFTALRYILEDLTLVRSTKVSSSKSKSNAENACINVLKLNKFDHLFAIKS